MKFPPELEPSISTISVTESLESSDPSTDSEFPWFSLPINGSEEKAGGGLRDSVTDNEIGWFPKTFFSIPVCTKVGKKQMKIS